MFNTPDMIDPERFNETETYDNGDTARNQNQTLTVMTTSEKTVFEEIKGTASEIISKITNLIKEGNARQLVIKSKKGRILFQSHLSIGVAGSALVVATAPIISAISMLLLFVNDVKILVEKTVETGSDEASKDENEIDAEIIDVSDEDEDDDSDTGKKSGSGKK